MSDVLYCKPIQISDAIELTKALASGPLSGKTLRVSIAAGLSSLGLTKESTTSGFAEWPESTEFLARCSGLSQFICSSFSISTHTIAANNQPQPGPTFTASDQDGFLTQIKCDRFNQLKDMHDEVFKLIAKHLVVQDKRAVLKEALPAHLKDIVEQRERNVDDLETSLRQLQTTTASLFEEQAKRALEFQKALATQADEQRTKLDEDYQNRRSQLDKDRAAFEEKRRNLDDRDSREVRRELKEQMLEAISDSSQISVPDNAVRTRGKINRVSMIAMMIGLSLMGVSVTTLPVMPYESMSVMRTPELHIFIPSWDLSQ